MRRTIISIFLLLLGVALAAPANRRRGRSREGRRRRVRRQAHCIEDEYAEDQRNFPNKYYDGCLQTASEYRDAFEAGTVQCVSPCLFSHFPDSSADPIWPAAAPAPPANVTKWIKGPRVATSFASGSDALPAFLQISADCAGQASDCVTNGILKRLGIDPTTFGWVAGDRLPFKIFGDDCSIYNLRNRHVQLSYAIYPDAVDRLTKTFDVNPRLMGVGPLRELQAAYSYSATVADAFAAVTKCDKALPFPSCANKTSSNSTSKCDEYSDALEQLCDESQQNYNSQQCIDRLKMFPKDADGAVSAVVLRAFFATCFDWLAEFQTNDGFTTAGDGLLGDREYLVTGDALLRRAGGSAIIYLTVA